jgi:transcriptional regulator of acetoin/glycerol metabolism
MAISDTISVEMEKPSQGVRTQSLLTLLLRADDPLRIGSRFSLEDAERIVLCRGSGKSAVVEGGALQLYLDDPGVSGRHAQLSLSRGEWKLEDLKSKNGTHVNGKRIEGGLVLADLDLIEIGHSFLLFRDQVRVASPLPVVLPASDLDEEPGLATFSPQLAQELTSLRAIAASRVPVVVRGETGTGKEMIAAAIHRLSGRPGPFVAVNCGSIAPQLAESELFGHRKGSFSGAEEDRPGLVRASHRGTLFLDEFAELPLATQATFLRALQESEVLPVGETRPVKVDLRVVVATHRDLEALVDREKLRADLLARVSGFTLTLPPLNERREDLGILIAALIRRHAADPAGVAFTPDAARALLLHSWPLNVRELDKALASACALARNQRIELRHLPPAIASALDTAAPAPGATVMLSVEEQQLCERLEQLLREHHGNVSAVAKAMGKFRNQVQRWMRRFGIDPTEFRD